MCPKCRLRKKAPGQAYCRICMQEICRKYYKKKGTPPGRPKTTTSICPDCGIRAKAPGRFYCVECSQIRQRNYYHRLHPNAKYNNKTTQPKEAGEKEQRVKTVNPERWARFERLADWSKSMKIKQAAKETRGVKQEDE